MTEPRVYGWLAFRGDFPGRARQVRALVAAPSFAAAQRAAEALGMERPRRDYSSTTGNDAEVEVAMSRPGMVFLARSHYGPEARQYDPADSIDQNDRG